MDIVSEIKNMSNQNKQMFLNGNGGSNMSKELIREYTKIAKELCYGSEIINAIKQANNENEVARILRKARLA